MTQGALWPFGESYLQVPKHFFEDNACGKLSVHAKLLYALMLDRQKLSKSNGWLDPNGITFIYYSVTSVSRILACSREKAIKTMRELEELGLITRIKKGKGKQDIIYVNSFVRDDMPLK